MPIHGQALLFCSNRTGSSCCGWFITPSYPCLSFTGMRAKRKKTNQLNVTLFHLTHAVCQNTFSCFQLFKVSGINTSCKSFVIICIFCDLYRLPPPCPILLQIHAGNVPCKRRMTHNLAESVWWDLSNDGGMMMNVYCLYNYLTICTYI